jgi:hypothetical protein
VEVELTQQELLGLQSLVVTETQSQEMVKSLLLLVATVTYLALAVLPLVEVKETISL